MTLTEQIEAEMNAHGLVTNVELVGLYVNFMINGAWHWARVTKVGNLKKDSIRIG